MSDGAKGLLGGIGCLSVAWLTGWQLLWLLGGVFVVGGLILIGNEQGRKEERQKIEEEKFRAARRPGPGDPE